MGCCETRRAINLDKANTIDTIINIINYKNEDLLHDLESSQVGINNGHNQIYMQTFVIASKEIFDNLKTVGDEYDGTNRLEILKSYITKFYENQFKGILSDMLVDKYEVLNYIKTLNKENDQAQK